MLRGRTNLATAQFLRRALGVDSNRQFANAGQMLDALNEALPKAVKKRMSGQSAPTARPADWRQIRRETFARRYGKALSLGQRCCGCREPIDERMLFCPWCGSDRNHFDTSSKFDLICPDCRRGVLPEWKFCPWCYGPGFQVQSENGTPGVRYQGSCRYCKGKLMRFMSYCPWCHRKVRRPWQMSPFPEVCGRCHWSVDEGYWDFCPWCQQMLKGVCAP